MDELVRIAIDFAAARAELAQGDLEAHKRAKKAGEQLVEKTQRALGVLPDELYKVCSRLVHAQDHNRR